jgi:two-component system, NtrC family, sensor kinase
MADIERDPRVTPVALQRLRTLGTRAYLVVPMSREGIPIGSIAVHRNEPGAFSNKHIELLTTFADQAVIAIENVRLFKELETSNRDLTEALEQQTATSEILRVISRSPTNIQPVFDTIVGSAVRLCGGLYGFLSRFDGELIHVVAQHNYTPEGLAALPQMYPMRPGRQAATGRAILTRAVVHIEDALNDPEYTHQDLARAAGWRSMLAVPMLREGNPIGAILVIRGLPGPFAETQIQLLKTFADQAVIAIENVRLFKELEARNNDLTATGEILRVIASSPTDLQPAFNVIASSALRLCSGVASLVFRYDGRLIHLAASDSAEGIDLEVIRHNFPAPPEGATFASRVVTMARPLYIADIERDPDAPPGLVEFARANSFRSIFAAPMRREDQTVGLIAVIHRDVGGFTLEQGALLQTFADQAVIAIENVRLFTETKEALEQQTATAEILRVIGTSPTDAEPVFETIAKSAVQVCGALSCAVFVVDASMVDLTECRPALPCGKCRGFPDRWPDGVRTGQLRRRLRGARGYTIAISTAVGHGFHGGSRHPNAISLPCARRR